MSKMQIPLDTAPDHAQALGRMIGHWALVESAAADILANLVCTPLRHGTHILWTSFISVSAKLDVIERLLHAEPYPFSEDEKRELLSAVAQVRTANGRRTSFVHATYAAGDEDTLTIFSNTMPRDTQKLFRATRSVSSLDIQAFVEEIAELSAYLQSLSFRIWPRGPRPPQYSA